MTSSVEYATARLTQLAYSTLNQTTASTHIAAWAYWGNMYQDYWTEPLVGKTWGGLNHGIYPLSWPLLCTLANNCPVTTNAPWPTRVGMVYLKMANGNFTYKPDGAPSWWPTETTAPLVTTSLTFDTTDISIALKRFLTNRENCSTHPLAFKVLDNKVNMLDTAWIFKNIP